MSTLEQTEACSDQVGAPDFKLAPGGRLICIGFKRWKAANVRPFMSAIAEEAVFAADVSSASGLGITSKDCFLIWGRDEPPGLTLLVEQHGVQIVRMEDGFVRSVGLGSEFVRPVSVSVDRRGIYFDPTRASDLEHLLNSSVFSQADIANAEQVREFIVSHSITKYNLPLQHDLPWETGGRKAVLVIGQVEDDASIRYGCTQVRTNLELLAAARRLEPAAFLVYKPHPETASGQRPGTICQADVTKLADHVETRSSVINSIEQCDVVHTMTSLTGFDALLRQKQVFVHGEPFYAGWGLTIDLAEDNRSFARRKRQLTLDELVAGTLLYHPIYYDWKRKELTTCQAALRSIQEARDNSHAWRSLNLPIAQRAFRQLRKWGSILRDWVMPR